jgi:hypothetical protein
LMERDGSPPRLASNLQALIGKAWAAPGQHSVEDIKRELAKARQRVARNRGPIHGSFRRMKIPRDPTALAKLIAHLGGREGS